MPQRGEQAEHADARGPDARLCHFGATKAIAVRGFLFRRERRRRVDQSTKRLLQTRPASVASARSSASRTSLNAIPTCEKHIGVLRALPREEEGELCVRRLRLGAEVNAAGVRVRFGRLRNRFQRNSQLFLQVFQ